MVNIMKRLQRKIDRCFEQLISYLENRKARKTYFKKYIGIFILVFLIILFLGYKPTAAVIDATNKNDDTIEVFGGDNGRQTTKKVLNIPNENVKFSTSYGKWSVKILTSVDNNNKEYLSVVTQFDGADIIIRIKS